MNLSLPTSDMDQFKKQLENPNTQFDNLEQKSNLVKVKKNLIIAVKSDDSGCGAIRCVFPMTMLSSIFGKSGRLTSIITPIMIYQQDILMRTRSIFFQRTMDPRLIPNIKKFKEIQEKLKFKMLGEVDDFLWKGNDEGEEIPEYNFGRQNISPEVQKASIEIMNYMDIECVSTEFLKWYLENKFHVKCKVIVMPNVVPKYFIGPHKRKPITKRIEKPRIINTSSPTHYNNAKKLKGDFDNAWYDWIVKNVIDNKITYIQMGGCPWFFEPIQNRPNFKVIPWVPSYQYYLPIRENMPDFSIGPLVPNFFNYSKSDLKEIESYGYGAVFIGSVFKTVKQPIGYPYNNPPSPYDNCISTVEHNCSYDDIDNLIKELCEPEKYNEVIKKQYEYLDKESRWLESPGNIKRWLDIL